jgi:tetratricopeptide (TPR) repeat protein
MRVVALLVVFLLGGFVANAWSLDAEQWFLDGNRLSSEGKFEEAAKAYQKSIDQNPLAPVAHYNMGIAYKNLRQLNKAVKSLEKAIELAPTNLDIRLTLGNVYNLQERWKDAIGQLNIVVHRQQNDAQAHGNLGWAYYNYKDGPPFKQMVILNLSKAVELFKQKNQLKAAESTRKILEEAKLKFGYQATHPNSN